MAIKYNAMGSVELHGRVGRLFMVQKFYLRIQTATTARDDHKDTHTVVPGYRYNSSMDIEVCLHPRAITVQLQQPADGILSGECE